MKGRRKAFGGGVEKREDRVIDERGDLVEEIKEGEHKGMTRMEEWK